jgi:hypothetical protein
MEAGIPDAAHLPSAAFICPVTVLYPSDFLSLFCNEYLLLSQKSR